MPLVDFPIFTQTDNTPEKLLINVDAEDLNESSKRKLKKYFEQNVLSQETLKKNSYIDLDKQLDLANFIQDKLNEIYRLMKWEQYPTNNQLKLSCMLIWNYFVSSNKRIYGVSSGKQLHFRLNQFREAGSIKNFISTIIEAEDAQNIDSINSAIELAFDIQRHWINYQFPRYLMSLGDIANDIFKRNNLPSCDYSYFANLVECYFLSPYVIPMDEYGLPIQISNKIGRIMDISKNMDVALEQLRNFIPSQRFFSSIEREFIDEFKAYI